MENNLSKKYIRSRLKVDNENTTQNNCTTTPKRYIEVRGLSSEDAKKYILSENKGIKGKLINFAFNHKESIKNIPLVGQAIISKKNSMLKQSITTGNESMDLSPYFGLYKTDFIAKMYELLLGRAVDGSGMNTFLTLMRNGASKGAVVYILSVSNEFAGRVKIQNIEQYKKEYKNYLTKHRILKIPLAGRLISVFTIKSQTNELYERIERIDDVVSHVFSIINEKINNSDHVLNEKINKLNDALVEMANENNNLLEEIKLQDKNNSFMLKSISKENCAQMERTTENYTQTQNISQKIEVVSKKMDMSLNIETSLSEKIDNLPQFIAGAGLKNKSMVTSVSGGVIAINMDDFIFGVPSEEWGLAMYLSQNGHFEYGSETFFESIISPDMTVVDIGANLGVYTLRALKKGCTVFSYEPTPLTFKILKQNIKANGFAETGRTFIYNYGVFEKHEFTKFSIVEGMCGHNSLYEESEGLKKIDVELISIDEHLRDVGKIDVIKIDIEGAEYFALKGMKDTVARNPQIKIIMELAPEHLKRAGINSDEIMDLIESYGLKYREIDENNGTLKDVTRQQLQKAYSVNLFLEREEV